MAYAAYREYPGVFRTVPSRRPTGPAGTANTTVFSVLDITVASTEACHVRRSLARCKNVGVLRCEPLLHAHPASENTVPRVRLMIRLPSAGYADVLHCLIECVPDGEIGHLASWREHLARYGVAHGG